MGNKTSNISNISNISRITKRKWGMREIIRSEYIHMEKKTNDKLIKLAKSKQNTYIQA